MKKSFLLTVFSFIITTAYVGAQNCGYYMPMKKNTGVEKKMYAGKDNLTGSYVQKIIDVTTENGFTVSKIETENFDTKGKSLSKSTYNVKCNGTTIMIDAKSLIDPKTLEAYKDMKVTVTSEDFEVPTNPTVGQTLKDGSANITVDNQGMSFATINMKITDRKIVAKENITVPAGTFECMKLTYNVKMQMTTMGFPITIEMKGVEYISSTVGSVKTETYDRSDQLLTYDVLTKTF